MTDIHIPPEAVEAGARAAYETPVPGASSVDEKPWEQVDGMLREYFVWQATAAIRAALENWPGMTTEPRMWRTAIILPINTENPDAEA